MKSLVALLALAIVLFLSTNVDDLVMLIAFFANSRFRARDIVAGQYAGTAVLFIVSAAGALLSLVIPEAYLGLLGIFPILVGIGKLLELRHDRAEATPAKDLVATTGSHGNIASVALVTVANGGDNIAAYTPVFRTSSAGDMAVTLCVFGLGVALWCAAGSWLASRRTITRAIGRWGHWIVPAVFVVIGVCILYKAGVLAF